MEESKIPGGGNILVTCECGVFEIYVRTVNGQHSLISNELICTKCGKILKVKDFIK